MPFTISHAAAVLPLRKLRLPLAAMMIGSMAPDFPYFLPGDLSRTHTHDLEGIFTFCWPAGLLVWLSFARLLERPSIELLPERWRTHLPRSDARFAWKPLALASLGVIVGALTHIAWDAFTHGDTAVARIFPLLEAEMFQVRGRPVHVYFMLQILSSVAGLMALAWWTMRLPNDAPARARRHVSRIPMSDRARIGILVSMMVVSTAVALASYAAFADARFEVRVYHMLINGMTTALLAWCAVAAAFTRLLNRRVKARS
jgi:hypothetical protein